MHFKKDMRHRIMKKVLENVPQNHFSPRPYQFELLDTVCERNTIICMNNNISKCFIIHSLYTDFSYCHHEKSMLVIAPDCSIQLMANTFHRHTGLQPLVILEPDDPQVSSARSARAIFATPKSALALCCSSNSSAFSISQDVFLLVVDECQGVLDAEHPYRILFGPRGLGHYSEDISSADLDCDSIWSRPDEYYETGCWLVPRGREGGRTHGLRILCFTSTLLPSTLTDPAVAKQRICELEFRLHSRLETSSELLNLLALGVHPQEEVLLTEPLRNETSSSLEGLVLRIIRETQDYLLDYHDESTGVADDPARSLHSTLSYCRRAVQQCEAIIRELGVWCGCQIARVFLKHLIRLDHCPPDAVKASTTTTTTTTSEAKILQRPSSVLIEDELTPGDRFCRLVRYTATQLALVVRVFHTACDTCMTLAEMREMASPKVLAFVDQLKMFKPAMNFRIEVSEVPYVSGSRDRAASEGLGLPTATISSAGGAGGSRRGSQRRRHGSSVSAGSSRVGGRDTATASLSSSSLSSSSSSMDGLSDSGSDAESMSSRDFQSMKLTDTRGRQRSRKAKRGCSSSSVSSHASSLGSMDLGGGNEGHAARLVYRAVPVPPPEGEKPGPGRLCGLVLVGCQFSAYALSRFIEELCIWDEDLFFVKAGHLFAFAQAPTGGGQAVAAAVAAAATAASSTGPLTSSLKTGDGDFHGGSTGRPQDQFGGTGVANTSAFVPIAHEETVAEFRRGGNVNLLITTQSAMSAAGGGGGAELPRCNLVACLRTPSSLSAYLASKARLHLVCPAARFLHFITRTHDSADGFAVGQASAEDNLITRYQQMEQLLIQRCRGFRLFRNEHSVASTVVTKTLQRSATADAVPLQCAPPKAISLINQYCARLPSDFLTSLTPRWRLLEANPSEIDPALRADAQFCEQDANEATVGGHKNTLTLYQCSLRLPINSPVKKEIRGKWMACKKLAKLSTAMRALRLLRIAKEVDARGEPSSREALISLPKLPPRPTSALSADSSTDRDSSLDSMYSSSRRRQYYYKKVPDLMTCCLPAADSQNYLFFIDLRLNACAPDAQNVRNRPCHRPETEALGFGLLSRKPLYHIPSFPIFSRSGEESARLVEFWSPTGSDKTDDTGSLPHRSRSLDKHQLSLLARFHRIIFRSVLRFEKDLLIDFDLQQAYTQVLVVPVRQDTVDIDWNFVNLTLDSYCPKLCDCRLLPRMKQLPPDPASSSKESSSTPPSASKPPHPIFEFRDEDYVNAVVTPTYRNLDQPPHYYVAEIRHDLSPLTSFPSKQFATFADYYTSKYNVKLSTLDQPLLDVDFTVLRLCLIVPRYLNPRGHSLPTTNEAKRQDRLEGVRHKQLLIPELCYRHAFPASVWRKAVCLPSIIYRVEHLLLAEELRQWVARDTGLGLALPPLPQAAEEPVFPPLRFIFPVELTGQIHLQRRVEEGGAVSNSGGRNQGRLSAGKRRKRRSGESNVAMVGAQGSGEEEDGEGNVSKGKQENKDSDADETDEEEQQKPTSVRLRLSALQPETDRPEDGLRSNMEKLLMESKLVSGVEKIFEDTMQKTGEDISEAAEGNSLLPVKNNVNADKEYPETESDVESVDSFEGNVTFFPSDDDDDEDEEEDAMNASGIRSERMTENSDRDSLTARHRRLDFKPSPAMILHALTMSCANEFINLERLETIGDSFLKFVSTVYPFLTFPDAHEGLLSHIRSRIVCNSNLFTLGRLKNLPDRMVGAKFEPHENWVPPGYIVPYDCRLRNPRKPKTAPAKAIEFQSDSEPEDKPVLINTFDPNSPEVLQTLNSGQMQCFVTIQQSIPDKSIADCVEALIGCYLTERGERSALKLMRWFGIDCLPDKALMRKRGPPWPPLSASDPSNSLLSESVILESYHAHRFPELEEIIGYKFKNPLLLLQACTHPSYYQLRRPMHSPEDFTLADCELPPQTTDVECYQRLEFLGDAVLDYLITRFLFEDSHNHSPGVLTDLRSALVNNNIFAALTVRIGLHRFLRASSPSLYHAIDAFVRFQKEVANDDLDFITSPDIELKEAPAIGSSVSPPAPIAQDDGAEAASTVNADVTSGPFVPGARPLDEVEIPKALGDIFESLAGAVFIDSDLCLNTVWRVFYPLIKERVERYTACIPKSPVRELLELEPESAKFERPCRTADGRIRVSVHVAGKGRFYGVGRNYRLAKSLAAKRALRLLHGQTTTVTAFGLK
uniref:Endoribonuclease Dcr-1 n=1 Tax=Schistocephalus solidus TaxID=70667 RepID=A0A0X3PUP9_SCHSO